MSLRKMCKELTLEALLKERCATTQVDDSEGMGRLQLVVDESTQRVINSFLKMPDLTEAGIVSIDLVKRHREPLPDLDALYLLRPDADNLDQIVDDFKQAGKPQHNQVHLAFTKLLMADELERLASGSNLPPRVRSLVEVPLSFVMVQDRGFHFDMPDCIPVLFPKPVMGVGDMLVSEIGHRLSDVCRCLQTCAPTIRHGQSTVCKLVADHVHQELLAEPKLPRIGSSSKREVPCQLLILDRSVDMATTLVHDYHYEAMAYDLLDAAGGNVTTTCSIDVSRNVVKVTDTVPSKSRNAHRKSVTASAAVDFLKSYSPKEDNAIEPPGKEALLGDNDQLWERLKGEHFQHAREELQRRVDDIIRSVDRREAGEMEVGDLLAQLRKTPEHKETIEKLDLHLSIFRSIDQRMQEERLSEGVGALEQDIACGVDNQGREIKPSELQTSFTSLINGLDSDLSGSSKLRLLMLYFTCMANVPEQVRQKLIDKCKLSSEDNHILMSFFQTKLMDVPESKSHSLGQGQVHRGVKTKQTKRFVQNARKDGRFELSRFDPKVKELLEQLTAGKLNEEDYSRLGDEGGFTPGAATLRSSANVAAATDMPASDDWSFAAVEAKPAGGAKASQDAPIEVTQRFVVFIIGGVTYPELRVASEVMRESELPKGTEVLMGGTSLLTSGGLIQLLRPRQAEDDPADLT